MSKCNSGNRGVEGNRKARRNTKTKKRVRDREHELAFVLCLYLAAAGAVCVGPRERAWAVSRGTSAS